jgi:hypothetical protein
MNWLNEMLVAVRSIADSLKRIAVVLEKTNVETDYSEEDTIVRGITSDVTAAAGRIPK